MILIRFYSTNLVNHQINCQSWLHVGTLVRTRPAILANVFRDKSAAVFCAVVGVGQALGWAIYETWRRGQLRNTADQKT